MSTPAFDRIYSELLSERGGVESMSSLDLSNCRRLAMVAADEDSDASTAVRNAQAMEILQAMLPVPRSGHQVDYANLTDGEVALLHRLILKAKGEVIPELHGRPSRTPRWEYGLSVLRLLDAAERRMQAAGTLIGGRDTLSSNERDEIARLAGHILSPVTYLSILFPCSGCRTRPIPDDATRVSEQPAFNLPLPPALPDNVVTLRP